MRLIQHAMTGTSILCALYILERSGFNFTLHLFLHQLPISQVKLASAPQISSFERLSAVIWQYSFLRIACNSGVSHEILNLTKPNGLSSIFDVFAAPLLDTKHALLFTLFMHLPAVFAITTNITSQYPNGRLHRADDKNSPLLAASLNRASSYDTRTKSPQSQHPIEYSRISLNYAVLFAWNFGNIVATYHCRESWAGSSGSTFESLALINYWSKVCIICQAVFHSAIALKLAQCLTEVEASAAASSKFTRSEK